ncbi:hypothetical protein PIB30_072188 [Stylosanthes scabra]|uniref:Sieve element occlusion N-terminal domain-containing protein n=1 Tax=Stylosanthes scabra TaxID=79078 RepID=A0ABU6VPY8_9FABA|nr:hypothetical protein [Stylosanthes scabra]
MSKISVNSSLNPFNVDDIKNIQDAKAVRQDVDSLFNVVSNIVLSSSTNFPRSLDLKQVRVDLVEEKVPESALRPTFSQLLEIVCQMTCHSFNESNAHESVVGVLKKLKSYKWDAKAVIALSAFALVCGETWQLPLTQATNKKANAVELHVFKLAEEEKKPAQSDSNLIKNTLKLIKGIIELEKTFFADKSCKALLSNARVDVYTYWAIFSLFACANNQVEPNLKNELVENLNLALNEIEQLQDLIWRFNALQKPSGISQLLKALIYPKDVDQFEIIANNDTTERLVTMEELKTKDLFLLISGLDNIEPVIEPLKLNYNSNANDKDKEEILWVPVVKNWINDEEKEKFKSLKSKMPWYVLQYFSDIKGYPVLQQEWGYESGKHYHGKPIMLLADASGKVLYNTIMRDIVLRQVKKQPLRNVITLQFK